MQNISSDSTIAGGRLWGMGQYPHNSSYFHVDIYIVYIYMYMYDMYIYIYICIYIYMCIHMIYVCIYIYNDMCIYKMHI